MGKNNKLINSINAIAQRKQQENIDKAANRMVTQVYAALAIALQNVCGFDGDQIGEVFAESQSIWSDFAGRGEEIIKLCEEETGCIIEFGNSE